MCTKVSKESYPYRYKKKAVKLISSNHLTQELPMKTASLIVVQVLTRLMLYSIRDQMRQKRATLMGGL